MHPSVEFSRKLMLAYGAACKPLCQELKLSQTAFDILMFLGNNPEYETASDIAEVRGIKANLISVNVERLVQDGYLRREPMKNDRRKVRLVCAERSRPIIEKGQKVQSDFLERLLRGVDEEMYAAFQQTIVAMGMNLQDMLKEVK